MHLATLRPATEGDEIAGRPPPSTAPETRPRPRQENDDVPTVKSPTRDAGRRARPPRPGPRAPCAARLQQLLAFAGLIVIFAFFSILSPDFFSYGNITNILFSTVVIGTLALGTTFVIITGGIDLSIGTGMALCAVMSGVLIVNPGCRCRWGCWRRSCSAG